METHRFTRQQWMACFTPLTRQQILSLGNKIYHDDTLLIPYCRFSIRFSQNLYEKGIPLEIVNKRYKELLDLELMLLRCIARGWSVVGKTLEQNPRAIYFYALEGLILGNTEIPDPMDVVKLFLIKFYYYPHHLQIGLLSGFLSIPFDYEKLY